MVHGEHQSSAANAPDTTAVLEPWQPGGAKSVCWTVRVAYPPRAITPAPNLFCAILTRTALQSLVKVTTRHWCHQLLMAVSARMVPFACAMLVRKLRIYAKY